MRATAKHTEFIRLVANGTNQSEAYRATVGNPKATLSAVKSKASNLAKKYANEIQQERERTRKVIEAAQDSKVAEIAKKDIMSKADRMEFLTKVANGEVKVKRPFVIGGKIMEYPSEPDHTERMKAIAELNKMEGDYAPTKNETNITGTIKVGYGSKE